MSHSGPIEGGIWLIGDPNHCPHLQCMALILEMPRFSTVPAHQPRLHFCTDGSGITQLGGGKHRNTRRERDTMSAYQCEQVLECLMILLLVLQQGFKALLLYLAEEESVMIKCLYLLSVVFHIAAGMYFMVKVTDTLEPGPSSSHDAAREEARDIQIEEEAKDDSASSDSSTDEEEEAVKSKEQCCALSGDNKQTEITRHKGGSVLLPCSCSDLNTKPQKVTWETSRTGRLTEMLNDEHYRGRFKLFNNISPANLSLLLSDLREEDGGVYRCSTGLQEHRDIRLYIKGCELVKAGLEAVTGFTGESVVLPCVCTDLQDKPKSVKWAFRRESGTNYQEIYSEQTGHHRNRSVKLVSKNPPGNLSLLISDLTEEDQGEYRCSAQADHKYFRLSVKVRRRETSTHSRKTDTTPPSEPTTLEQDKQQTHSSLPIGAKTSHFIQ
ncbi:uncharacterized protein LOC132869182 [Neoarius graeffei]|uniref:uncharacterized protein LOC132869182 n=1 Tax=Neoarius graeffei TaxID=443677 RepID=UPI00298C6B64|nr:uncharacterized protein LOC132869182 [Neoarius graeffei]